MRRKYSWLLMLLVASMLVAACGPEMATPTPAVTADDGGESQATPPQEGQESTVPVVIDYPVDEDDWHVLGSPDAPVTMVEYSDFQ